MAFPKYGVRTILEKYPDAESVMQLRYATREGDVVTYEGVVPAALVGVLLEAIFDQSMREALDVERPSVSEGNHHG
jgi:hypothetical protein